MRSVVMFGWDDVGLTIGDITWDYCVELTTLVPVVTNGSQLFEIGNGVYVLSNPNAVTETIFGIHITADPSRSAENIFSGDAISAEIQRLYNLTLQIGSLSLSQSARQGDKLVLFTNANCDDLRFVLGPDWSTYLSEDDAEVWFTIKATPRDARALVDVQGSVADAPSGIVSVTLTAADMAIREGTYDWQIQIRRVIQPPGDPLPAPTINRRLAMEGRAYIKPTFRTV